MIARQLSSSIQRLLPKFPVLSITGPRQAGKTTLLKNLLPEYRYINLEDSRFRDAAIEDPHGFLNSFDQKVIFDEIQRTPDLFSAIQVKVDEEHMMGRYVLSGSQNFLLLEKISQSLAGRVAVLKLLPFSMAELFDATKMPDTPETAMFQGGYPVLHDRIIEPADYFPSYLETYLERDVREVTNVKDLRQYYNFVRLCAGRVGQPVNVQSLAADCGISFPTAKNWLSILEASYIIFMLPPFFENFHKRIIKTPKLYFFDTGLLCFLLGLNAAQQIDQYYQRGSLFENFVVADLLKNRYHQGRPINAYFWKDSHQVEVDLILQEAGQTDLYEIKYSHTPKPDHFKGLTSFRNTAMNLFGNNYIIYAGEIPQRWSQASFVPWTEIRNL